MSPGVVVGGVFLKTRIELVIEYKEKILEDRINLRSRIRFFKMRNANIRVEFISYLVLL